MQVAKILFLLLCIALTIACIGMRGKLLSDYSRNRAPENPFGITLRFGTNEDRAACAVGIPFDIVGLILGILGFFMGCGWVFTIIGGSFFIAAGAWILGHFGPGNVELADATGALELVVGLLMWMWALYELISGRSLD